MACIGFAHRGASADARENTLEAFALALELGATGIESDVWFTADGVAVLDHDGRIPDSGARESIARGRRISDVTCAELPPHIPTLEQLYAECGNQFELCLDVNYPEGAADVVRIARKAGAEDRLWLCYYNWRVLAPWRSLSEKVRLVESARLQHMRTAPAARAERLAALDIDALNLHWSEWSAPLALTFRTAGRKLLAWDTQEESSLQTALGFGVDGVFSDHVARMMSQLSSFAR
jgi:glycerophosphoryl diester phosphodiesterase